MCQRLAERHGFTVAERFSDAAMSGGTSERPGYQALLRAARARVFNVIIAEDTSRLWRSLPEQWRAVSELMDSAAHIVTQDIDTRAENFKILLSVHGAMADVHRDQIAYRTRRGLEGPARKAIPCGGRAYGYIAARDTTSGDREIYPEQAETVRQIFQWFADGQVPALDRGRAEHARRAFAGRFVEPYLRSPERQAQVRVGADGDTWRSQARDGHPEQSPLHRRDCLGSLDLVWRCDAGALH